MEFFPDVQQPVVYAGVNATDEMSYKIYDPSRIVAGKTMAEQLRIAVCYWHSFNWPGSDIFGAGTFDRPWLDPGVDPMDAARAKQDAAFEFFTKLGVPYYCFHDVDMAPEGATLRESRAQLEALVDRAGEKMADTGVSLLWGTANVFSHPRYAAGRRPIRTRISSPTPPLRSATCWMRPTDSAARTTCSGVAGKGTRRCSTPE